MPPTDEQLYRARARQAGVPFAHLARGAIRREVIGLLPPGVVRRMNAIPVAVKGRSVVVAMSGMDRGAVEDLQAMLGCPVVVSLTTPAELADALGVYYGSRRDRE